MEGLGADQVIDHRAQRFEGGVGDLDVVLDTVGGDTLERSFATLKRGGHLASVVTAPDEEAARRHGVTASRVYFRLEPGRLQGLVDRVAARHRVVIDRVVPFARWEEAFARQASGRARGKVVIAFP